MVTPTLSPMFDLKLVIAPPLVLLRMSPFLTDNLNRVSLYMSNAPAVAVEVIVGVVGVVTYRAPTMK